MLTATETIQAGRQVDYIKDDIVDPFADIPAVVDKGVKKEDIMVLDGRVIFDPKPRVDRNGNTYLHVLTKDEFWESVDRAEKDIDEGRYYTTDEVRQKLSDMMRQADEEFDRGDYITEKEMWADMGELRAGIPRE